MSRVNYTFIRSTEDGSLFESSRILPCSRPEDSVYVYLISSVIIRWSNTGGELTAHKSCPARRIEVQTNGKCVVDIPINNEICDSPVVLDECEFDVSACLGNDGDRVDGSFAGPHVIKAVHNEIANFIGYLEGEENETPLWKTTSAHLVSCSFEAIAGILMDAQAISLMEPLDIHNDEVGDAHRKLSALSRVLSGNDEGHAFAYRYLLRCDGNVCAFTDKEKADRYTAYYGETRVVRHIGVRYVVMKNGD